MADDTYRAQIKLKVGGADNTEMLDDLIAVTVDSNLHLPTMLTVELFDDTLEWIDDSSMELGNEVDVMFSEQPDPDSTTGPLDKVIFQGEITSIEPRFNKDGKATLLFRAYDK